MSADQSSRASLNGSASKPEKAVVLLVDDDPAVLTSLKFALELEGFAVRVFPNAQSLLREHTNSIGHRTSLVIDYRLPDTNGIDLLQRLRARGVTAPAILITSHPSDDLRKRAAAMATPIIEKPLLDNSLIAKLREQHDIAESRPST